MPLFNLFLFSEEDPMQGTIDLVHLITVIALALLAVVIIVLAVSSAKSGKTDTRSLTYGAVCVAASFVLSFLKYSMPFGGSVTLASLIPLFLYAYAFGPVKGLLAGVVYGLLQFVQDAWFLNGLQFLLDYPLAFAGVALAGVFRKPFRDKPAAAFCGLAAFMICRVIMHLFSGIIFVEAGMVSDTIFGPGSQFAPVVYSLIYNLTYLIPDFAICFAALGVLVGSKSFNTLVGMMQRPALKKPANEDPDAKN